MAQLLHQDIIHFSEGFHPVTQHPQDPSALLLCQELQAESCQLSIKKKESFKLSAAIRKAANRDHSVLDMATATQDTELLPWHLNASLYTSCITIVLLAIKIQSFPGN